MMKPCEWCRKEAIHFIMVGADENVEPSGEFWFCCWNHLLLWIKKKCK